MAVCEKSRHKNFIKTENSKVINDKNKFFLIKFWAKGTSSIPSNFYDAKKTVCHVTQTAM